MVEMWPFAPAAAASEAVLGPQLSDGLRGTHRLRAQPPHSTWEPRPTFSPRTKRISAAPSRESRRGWRWVSAVHPVSAQFLRASGPPSRKIPSRLDPHRKLRLRRGLRIPAGLSRAARLCKASLGLSQACQRGASQRPQETLSPCCSSGPRKRPGGPAGAGHNGQRDSRGATAPGGCLPGPVSRSIEPGTEAQRRRQ